MHTVNLAASGLNVTSQGIDTQQLLKMVNAARKQYGEPQLRNNKFIEKVEDELEGDTYTKSVGRKNGQEIDIIHMTIKQSIRVAARESKSVRRALVDKLESMAHNDIRLPNRASGLDTLRAARSLQMLAETSRDLLSLFPNLCEEARQVAVANIINPVMGYEVIQSVAPVEKTYSATEVGEVLGVSAIRVGKLANANGLKTREYGMHVLSKSKYGENQVSTFRYNEKGLEALCSLLNDGDLLL